jgi:hypothetical protein
VLLLARLIFVHRSEIVTRKAILKIRRHKFLAGWKGRRTFAVTKIVFFVLIVLGWQAEVQQLNVGPPTEIRRRIRATPEVLRAVGGQSGRNTPLLE